MGKKKRAPKTLEAGSKTSALSGVSRITVISVLLGVTALTFVNAIVYDDFAYDDDTQILKDTFIRNLRNLPKAMVTEAWFWRVQQSRDPNKENKPTTPYYRPVFTVYLMIGWKVFQDWAPGWHFTSVLLHLLAVYLAFLIIEEISGQLILSGVAALIFAIHPLRSESVAWISGVTDLLLAVFLLGSFYFYLLFRRTDKREYLIWALSLFLIASFCKEPAVSLPIFIGAYELVIADNHSTVKQRVVKTLAYTLPFLAVSIFYFAMRFYSLQFLLSDPTYTKQGSVQVLLTIPIVISKYIGLSFFPVNLSIFHETAPVGSPLDFRFVVPVIFLAGIAFLLRPAWKTTLGKFAVVWFIANLIPALNLYAFDSHFMVQERYLYLSSIGFAVLIAMAIDYWRVSKWMPISDRKVGAAIATGVICLLMTGKTFAQNLTWKDDLTLYTHGAEVADDQSMPHYILGHRYIRTFEWEKVADELEKCVELNPKSIVAINNLANAHLLLFEKTRTASHVLRASSLCEQALNELPDDTDNATKSSLWDTLGHCYDYDTSIRDYDRALTCFAQGLKFAGDNPLINAHIGATLIKQNKFAQALPYLETARSLSPDLPDTYKFLGYVYSNLGQTQNAIDNLTTYLAMVPNAVDAPQERKQLDALQARLRGSQADNKEPAATQN